MDQQPCLTRHNVLSAWPSARATLSQYPALAGPPQHGALGLPLPPLEQVNLFAEYGRDGNSQMRRVTPVIAS